MPAPASAKLRVAVFGAGAIGCWVGGRLAARCDVTLIGRPRVLDELGGGLAVSDLDGATHTVTPALARDAAAAAGADLVLVTVKSAQTAGAGAELARVLPDLAVVVSLQNGVRNADVLRAALPGRTVLAAMVPFNVIRKAPGAYHRATSGALAIDERIAHAPRGPAFVEATRAAGLGLELHADMTAVQWAKLVMNLNNAINALSGIPLAAELAQRSFRRCLAAAQRECLELLARAGQPVAKLTAIPPRWMPRLLELPDAVFRVAARRVIAIDPAARSSMWDDLEGGRPTEIDYLQGEVVALAERAGRSAPVNRTLARLVREAQAGGRRDFSGPELARVLGL